MVDPALFKDILTRLLQSPEIIEILALQNESRLGDLATATWPSSSSTTAVSQQNISDLSAQPTPSTSRGIRGQQNLGGTMSSYSGVLMRRNNSLPDLSGASTPSTSDGFQGLMRDRSPRSRDRSSTVQEEFRKIYRFGRQRSVYGIKKSVASQFVREVILLSSRNIFTVLKGRKKTEAYQQNLVKRVNFNRSMTAVEVEQMLHRAFPVLGTQTFKVLFPSGTDLIDVPLEKWESLNGELVYQLFKGKTLYVQPKTTLNCDSYCSDDELKSSIDDRQNITYEISTDDDNHAEDICEAIRLSLTSSQDVESKTFADHLKTLQLTVNVNRKEVLNSIFKLLDRQSFDLFRKIEACFVDEDAIDDGGPLREMWRLAFLEMQSLPIFEGGELSKIIKFNLRSYISETYFRCGKVIAMALIHDGPGPHFLSKTLCKLITSISDSFDALSPEIGDVGDADIYAQIKKVSDAETVNGFRSALGESDFFFKIGPLAHNADFDNKNEIVQGALKYYISSNVLVTEQFKRGLTSGGILDLLRKFPEDGLKLLSFCEEDMISISAINKMFKIKFSEEGSNKRSFEEIAVCNWRDYLEICADEERKVTLKDVFTFITGSSNMPPLGFRNQPEIQFLHDKPPEAYPEVATCGPTLFLPLISNSNLFTEKLDEAILNSKDNFTNI